MGKFLANAWHDNLLENKDKIPEPIVNENSNEKRSFEGEGKIIGNANWIKIHRWH